MKKYKNMIINFLKDCQSKIDCDGCPFLFLYSCLGQNADLRGMNLNIFTLSKTEKEVLYAIHEKNSKSINKKNGSYTARHGKAIDSLKAKNLIFKDEENILKINYDAIVY